MEEKELISIVVPVFNGEKYLKECINSIKNNEYKNIEIIIVDDGSTDKTLNIANSLSEEDSRIRVIHQDNAGVSTARNKGIDNAKGEYICFVDSDDFISKDYIGYFYKLIKQENAEIALTPMPRKFNEQTKYDFIDEEKDFINVLSGNETAKQMLYYNIVIAPWNKMISLDLIRKNNLKFNPELSFGEGFNFSVDCFQRANRVAIGHRKVYQYRVDNPNSVMTKFSLKLVQGSIRAQEVIKENLVTRSKDMLKACKYANWHTYCDCFNTIVGSGVAKKYPELYKKIKKVCRKDSLCALGAPISLKEKIKSLIYFISPFIASKLINHFRIRKFTIESN